MRDRYPEYRILMKKMCPIKPLKQPEAMDLPDCSYYLHGVCISYLFNRFIADNSQCLPACNSFNFHVESPQVIKLLYLFAVFPRNVTLTIVRSDRTCILLFSISVILTGFLAFPFPRNKKKSVIDAYLHII